MKIRKNNRLPLTLTWEEFNALTHADDILLDIYNKMLIKEIDIKGVSASQILYISRLLSLIQRDTKIK